MKFALHTPASRPVIHQTLAQGEFMSTLDSVTFVHGITPGRASDCFYGWSEAHRDESCKPHNIVQSRDIDGLKDLARALMRYGTEVVITEDHDWSKIIPTAPIYYLATHTH